MTIKTIISYTVIFISAFTTVRADDLKYKPGELIVRFAPKPDGKQRTLAERNQLLTLIDAGTVKHSYKLVPGLTLVTLPENISVENALPVFRAGAGILYAEPNYKVKAVSTFPNDPNFSQLWGMHNTGQTGGTADADIDAPEAWDMVTDSDIIVAVIDTGVDYNHPDLAANMWTNEAELNGNPNVDDDDNGYVDDIYGYDFCTYGGKERDSDPIDDAYHGTHCAGTIGAVGNNGVGVTGVCWNVKIMAVKFLHASGVGWIDDAIKSIEYAVQMGAHVLNNSWGNFPNHQGLKDTIEAADANGVLFVAAAGNSGDDIDDSLFYPASYDCDNIISVMATDHDDIKSWHWYDPEFWESNYGAESVDLGAPGSYVLSTFPTYETDAMAYYGLSTYYEILSGTSMATPHVAGACALVWSAKPTLSHLDVKLALIQMVDRFDNYNTLCVSSGRLNLDNAIRYVPAFDMACGDNLAGACLEPQDEITYTIYYQYNWNDPNDPNDPNLPGPTSVSIVDYLPAGLDPAGELDDPNDEGLYNAQDHTVTWNVNELLPATPCQRQLQLQTNEKIIPDSQITNTCSIFYTLAREYSISTENNINVCDCSSCGEVIYVDPNVSEPNNGTSWEEAFDDVQDALAAAYPCDEIWVAEGLYKPTDSPSDANATFDITNSISVYGGFEVGQESLYDRDWLSNETTLSGQLTSTNVFYVVSIGDPNVIAPSMLDGFTVTGAADAGIYCKYTPAVIQHNRIHDNDDFGILCTDNAAPVIRNNWIYQNASDGIRLVDPNGQTVIRNNTIVNNSQAGINLIPGYKHEPAISNCIIWGHPDTNDLIGCNATWSCFGNLDDPNDPNVYGNISEEPLFVDAENDDYHLYWDSPCIDAGDPNGSYVGESDIDHQQRVADGDANGTAVIDMGADEYCSGSENNEADFNSDDIVNFQDYAQLANAWQTASGGPGYDSDCDLSGDQAIDVNDLAVFTDNWFWQACWTTPWESQINMMMAMGMGGMEQQLLGEPAESAESIDIDVLVEWLEQLWSSDKGVREMMTRPEWKEFIESVKASAEPEN